VLNAFRHHWNLHSAEATVAEQVSYNLKAGSLSLKKAARNVSFVKRSVELDD
jgi:hypothetical protein